MYFFIITSFITAFTSIFLGVLVYIKNKKNLINRLFGFYAVTVFIWSFSYGIWLLQKNPIDALFWSRMLNMGATLIPIAYLHWVLTFLKKNKEKRFILVFGYILTFVFLLFSFSDYYVKGVKPISIFPYWPQANWLYFLYLAFSYCGMVFYGSYLLYKSIKTTTGSYKGQIKYAFLGSVIGFIGGATNFPLMLGVNLFPPIGNPLVITYPLFFAYAILKYRLMDIRVAVKRSTVFSGLVITITAAYTLAAFLLSWVIFGGVYTFRTQIIVGLIVAFLIAIGFRPLYDWLRRVTDTFLFKGEYRPQELMADISDVLSRTLDLDKVIDTLKEQISRALRVEKMEVVVLEEGKSNPHFRENSKITALKKLIAHFKKQKEVLVLEELKRKQAEKVKFDKSFLLIKELEKLKTALAIPLLLKEKLVGLFLLTAKKSGDMFTNEDIKTLEAIAAQAAIALENARLYEEMKDFSKTLQKEVNRQTKSLRDANIRLEQLDKAKSEFISLASHQLRTPLSIIKGYISMILEGTWGETNEKQKEHLEKVYLSNERLIKLVEDLLTVSRIESGRLEFDLQPLALDNLTEGIVKEFSQMVAKKGLYLKYLKPKKPLPKVKADSLKIRQVIQNLIDNAIHYTKKGGATIHLKAEKNKVRFSIEDTGIGVSSQEQVILFEKFSRGKGVTRMHTEGTGLGLYLAAKLIQAHQGRIWVESEGQGQGSTFCFELPMGKRKN